MSTEAEAKPVTLAPKMANLRLDLGGGDNPRHGFESVDLFAPKAKWQQNLLEFPWPWGDGQVAEINCSHFIEHIPMKYVSPEGCYADIPVDGRYRDLLTMFFDEAYRVLAPGGKMTVQWPCHRSDRAFQDPTHRRYIPPAFALYLCKSWREANGLGHYLGAADFTDGRGGPPSVAPIGVPQDFALYPPEATARRINEGWNIVQDWQMIAVKESH